MIVPGRPHGSLRSTPMTIRDDIHHDLPHDPTRRRYEGDPTAAAALEKDPALAAALRRRLLARLGGEAGPPPRVVRRGGRWQVPLAAAVALLLSILGYREIGFRAERARTSATLSALQYALTAREGELAAANVTLARQERDVAELRAALAAAQASAAILDHPGLRMVSLKTTVDGQPAEGHVLLSPPTGRALFYAFGLPALAAAEVYELWWMTEKAGPLRAAIFHPDAQGVARADPSLPDDAGAVRGAMVTVEAAGGAPAPRGSVVLQGDAP
ncbi:anti-sigma factor [bacterium]|nr:anti-sigma factor [bacterium]